MSVNSDIRNAIMDGLGPTIGARVFPDGAPIETPTPFITYERIGGQVVELVASKSPDLKNGRFQFNIWAETREEADLIADRLEVVLMRPPIRATALGGHSAAADDTTDLRGTQQDFSIWYRPA